MIDPSFREAHRLHAESPYQTPVAGAIDLLSHGSREDHPHRRPDPRTIEGWHEGLRCLDDLRSVDMPGLDELPASGRLAMWVLARLPGFRDIGRILRYRF